MGNASYSIVKRHWSEEKKNHGHMIHGRGMNMPANLDVTPKSCQLTLDEPELFLIFDMVFGWSWVNYLSPVHCQTFS